MTATVKAENTTQQATVVNKAIILKSVLSNATTVAEWATARLVVNEELDSPISWLYEDYGNYCRRENVPPLLRKTWIGAMKLGGFQTQCGAFVGLILKEMTGNFATISRA